MDGKNNQYAQYLMYLLGQLMQRGENQGSSPLSKQPFYADEGKGPAAEEKAKRAPSAPESDNSLYFSADETRSRWRREEKIELLEAFCREGYPMAKKYGHFLVGTSADASYIAIPGRFLIAEQPAGGKTGFTLWQPLRGGEEIYRDLEGMTEEEAENVYGYWIAAIDPSTLKLSEV